MYNVERTHYKPVDSMVLSSFTQTQLVAVTEGQNLKKGDIVKMVDGKASKDDGADTSLFYGIMANDIDATETEKEAYCYTLGSFNEDAVIFPEGKTYEDYKQDMRKLGIVLEKTQKAVNELEG